MSEPTVSASSPLLPKLGLAAAIVVLVGIVVLAVLWPEPQPELPAPREIVPAATPTPAEPTTPEVVPELVPELVPAPLEPAEDEPTFADLAAEEAPPAVEEPLPSLDESDSPLMAEVKALPLDALVLKRLVGEEMIRKFVRAVENMRQGKLVHKFRPMRQPAQAFYADKIGEQYRMSFKGYHRYDAYVEALASLDKPTLVALYRRYYPLLQQAYAELGTGASSFHAAMLGAIDHLLRAPVIESELLLTRPSVMYKYKDPALEKLSGPHKLMLRMGPENTRSVQRSLRELRQALAE